MKTKVKLTMNLVEWNLIPADRARTPSFGVLVTE